MILVLQVYDGYMPGLLFCLEILHTSLPLKRPYIYNILMACSHILFLISTANGFPVQLLLIPVDTVLFSRYTILENYSCKGIKERNASILF